MTPFIEVTEPGRAGATLVNPAAIERIFDADPVRVIVFRGGNAADGAQEIRVVDSYDSLRSRLRFEPAIPL